MLWKVFYYNQEITMPDVRVARWKVGERGGVLWNEDDSRVSACCLKEEGEDRTGVNEHIHSNRPLKPEYSLQYLFKDNEYDESIGPVLAILL
ncbi:BQ5605_C017g08305 [Microbotryum silenes-dioicae]|uniref:BQ5605_C017g08305 protein n=1 Tax=Microbotryum silenes-dioicae TaxID=796604 RepID=A0A2X0LYB6_9BASI|nr:BQ5605_C017g08305 [Microbotryum silenes-dioicae]